MQIPLTASNLRGLVGHLHKMAVQGDRLLWGLSVLENDRALGAHEIQEGMQSLLRLGLTASALRQFSKASHVR